VAEEEAKVRVGLEASLRIAGHDVATAADGEEALRMASQGRFDIIVLDSMLPLKDGIAVCEELRANDIRTPVVMLTARTQAEDMLQGFAAGADDYITKPFEAMELLARISAIMRRTLAAPEGSGSEVHQFGEVRVDIGNAAVWRGEQRLRLSMMEYALLQYFVRHPAEVLDRRRILDEVWGSDPEIGPRTVDVHVAWLRKKLGDNQDRPRWIRTVHGKGYTFDPN
jgi:DNA-binding response OmpR family regulator